MSETEITTDESKSTATDETNVRIHGFTKEFQEDSGDTIVAVDDLNIDIERGEFLVFVGPSGCGKTTTLRTVAGLESPTEGKIWIEGKDVTDLDPRERGIAMVFQNYALYPHMTVRENMSFPLGIRNYSPEVKEQRVEETAALLEISELLDRKPSQLSGGQQQRVALGRAIVREPSVFLMDEPLSNLDAKLRLQMRTELNEIHQKLGKTTIYVTHDQAEAMTLGDRVAVLNDGQLQQIGSPQYLYDNPANRFVAGFLGEPPMNFVPVSVEERNDGYVVDHDAFRFAVPDTHAAKIDEHGVPQTAEFGIRPENLNSLSEAETEGIRTENSFQAGVQLVEPMGSDKFLTLELSDGTETTARVSPDTEISAGSDITLVPNLHKSHLFNQETGENIYYEEEGTTEAR